MEQTMKYHIVNLNAYIVDKNWALCRVITSSCRFYSTEYVPMIDITDKLLKKLINCDRLYFYDYESGRFNFYCNTLDILRGNNIPNNASITIELMEVGDEYILLAPGLWKNTPDGRYRICDDGYLYRVIDMITPESKAGNDFCKEFFEIYDRLYSPQPDISESSKLSPNSIEKPVTIESNTDVDEIVGV